MGGAGRLAAVLGVAVAGSRAGELSAQDTRPKRVEIQVLAVETEHPLKSDVHPYVQVDPYSTKAPKEYHIDGNGEVSFLYEALAPVTDRLATTHWSGNPANSRRMRIPVDIPVYTRRSSDGGFIAWYDGHLTDLDAINYYDVRTGEGGEVPPLPGSPNFPQDLVVNDNGMICLRAGSSYAQHSVFLYKTSDQSITVLFDPADHVGVYEPGLGDISMNNMGQVALFLKHVPTDSHVLRIYNPDGTHRDIVPNVPNLDIVPGRCGLNEVGGVQYFGVVGEVHEECELGDCRGDVGLYYTIDGDTRLLFSEAEEGYKYLFGAACEPNDLGQSVVYVHDPVRRQAFLLLVDGTETTVLLTLGPPFDLPPYLPNNQYVDITIFAIGSNGDLLYEYPYGPEYHIRLNNHGEVVFRAILGYPPYGSGQVSDRAVLLARLVPDCPGDITTTGGDEAVPDGETNLSDLQFYLSRWATSDTIADVNTTGTSTGEPDGEINLSDLQYYMTVWQNGMVLCPSGTAR